MWRIAALILVVPCLASAQVFFTEIMYDLKAGSDTGREWIEVYNAGTSAVDLTTWKLVESGKNHKISRTRGILAPGTYAVIADNPSKFMADHPDYTGTLFDSAFSLSNDGETLTLVAGNTVVDELKFTASDGAHGTGDSLQRIDIEARVLAPGAPTPGAGIPEGGLVQSPQESKNAKSTAAPSAAALPIQGERAERAELQVAAVSASLNPSVWWLGVTLVALWGAGGIVYARRLRATEWEIIEET